MKNNRTKYILKYVVKILKEIVCWPINLYFHLDIHFQFLFTLFKNILLL